MASLVSCASPSTCPRRWAVARWVDGEVAVGDIGSGGADKVGWLQQAEDPCQDPYSTTTTERAPTTHGGCSDDVYGLHLGLMGLGLGSYTNFSKCLT
jgi:hypothetical protein